VNRSKRRMPRKAVRFNLYAYEITLGWRVTHHEIPYAVGAAKVASGEWRSVVDECGNLIGFQPVRPKQKNKPESVATSCTLTARDMERNAFGPVCSVTIHLSDKEKKYEDAVEQSINKVHVWPFPASRIDDGSGDPVYGDRAIRVYPKNQMSEG